MVCEAQVHLCIFSGFKGLHQGMWSQQENPNVAALYGVGQALQWFVHVPSVFSKAKILNEIHALKSITGCCFQISSWKWAKRGSVEQSRVQGSGVT